MESPVFGIDDIYNFVVFDSDDQIIHKGLMNEKSWNKTIENNVIWEYIPANGRVLEHIIDDYIVDTKNTKIKDQIINIYVVKKSYNLLNKELNTDNILGRLEEVIIERKRLMPENSYTTHLFSKGESKILKKFGEEAVELLLASGSKDEIVYESADVLYHLMVYLVYKGISFDEILLELKTRMN